MQWHHQIIQLGSCQFAREVWWDAREDVEEDGSSRTLGHWAACRTRVEHGVQEKESWENWERAIEALGLGWQRDVCQDKKPWKR